MSVTGTALSARLKTARSNLSQNLYVMTVCLKSAGHKLSSVLFLLRYSGPEYCGILSDEAGPFAGCHPIVPVKEFVDDCLYDVCLNDGMTDVLCGAVGAYLAECQEAKAPVAPWRGLAGCRK